MPHLRVVTALVCGVVLAGCSAGAPPGQIDVRATGPCTVDPDRQVVVNQLIVSGRVDQPVTVVASSFVRPNKDTAIQLAATDVEFDVDEGGFRRRVNVVTPLGELDRNKMPSGDGLDLTQLTCSFTADFG